MWQVLDHGYEQIKRGNQEIVRIWSQEVLFSWRWWVVFALAVCPWAIAWVLMAREKRQQYLISSLILIGISSLLDIAGLTFDLWRYYVTLIPVMGGFFPWDMTVLPVAFILAYEIRPQWSPWVKGLLTALVMAFVGEPFTETLGLTNHLAWKHAYSFPIYYLLYVVAYFGSLYLSRSRKETVAVEEQDDKYRYIFENSFDSIYAIERTHKEKEFRFIEVNHTFCEQMGYSREEFLRLDPRLISDQERYNVDVKYRPLLKKGDMKLDTTLVTKTGEKKYVRLNVKVFWLKEKVQVLSIAKFLEKQVAEENVT
ncbi:MAG: CBO0543 family protein [Tumebacillaceae bacterium]